MGKKVIGAVLVVAGAVMMAYGNSSGLALMKMGGQMLVMSGLAMMLAPTNDDASNRKSQKFNPRTGIEPKKLIYGHTVVGGPLIYAETLPGKKKKVEDFLHRIAVLAGHPIEEIKKVWLSDQKVDLKDVNNYFSDLPAENWRIGKKKSLIIGVTQTEEDAPDSVKAIQVRKAAGSAWALGGTSSESVNNTVVSDTVAANSTRKVNECPYLYVRLQLVEDGWKSVPQIRAEVLGKRILSATEIKEVKVANPSWSDNEVLTYMTDLGLNNIPVNTNSDGVPYIRYGDNPSNCILDYLLDYKLGLGVPLSEIDLDTFIEGETVSDEVPYSAARTENLKLRGTDTDATITAGSDDAQSFYFETKSVRHPMVSFNESRGIFINGRITVTLPDESILEDRWINAYNTSKRGLRYVGGSTTGNTQNDFDMASYIDIETGLVYIKTLTGYDSGSTGIATISFTASTKSSSIRYSCNGMLSLDATPIQNVEELLTSCAGMLTYSQGKYKLYVGKWEVPKIKPGIAFTGDPDNPTNPQTDYVHITEEDLAGPIQIKTGLPRSERFNAVKGVFADKEADWELTDFPEVKNSAYKEADAGADDYVNPARNGYLYRDLNLPFTTDVDTAARIAKLFLDRGRQSLSLQLTCKPSALQFSPGDNVYVSLPSLGSGEPTRADSQLATITVDTDGSGTITSVSITDGGLGYLYPPDLSVGSTATATTEAVLLPVLDRGTIKEIVIVDGGLGYDASSTLDLDIVHDITPVNYWDDVDINFWENKIFKVESWTVNEEGLVEMGLKEDAFGIYADTTEEFSSDPSPDIQDGVTSREGMLPSNLRLTNVAKVIDGQFSGGVSASWDLPEDVRNVLYYQVELGVGALWKKKITDISMAAARRDTVAALSPVQADAAAITYEWQAAYDITEPALSGLDVGTINVPAKLHIAITSAGSGYKIDPMYGSESNYFYTTITDDTGGNATNNTARLKFTINPSTGGLVTVRILEISGAFGDNGIVAIDGTAAGGTEMRTAEEPFYRSEVTFNLDENILNYPDYKTIASKWGVFSSYIFDTDDLSSHTGGYGSFISDGTASTNTTFSTGFDNVVRCVEIDTAPIVADIPVTILDLETENKRFSIETVFSVSGTTERPIWEITDSSDQRLLYASIQASSDTIRIYNNAGSFITADLSTLNTPISLAVDTPYHVVYKERGDNMTGKFRAELYVNGQLANHSNSVYTQSISADKFVLGGTTAGTQVGVFNIYGKPLTELNIQNMFYELDNTAYPDAVFGDVKKYSITDIEQQEFNGNKSLIHNARMTSNTEGKYDIIRVDEVCSFISDTDGLPGANEATFGSYVYNEAKTEWYAVESVVRTMYSATGNEAPPPATNLLTFKTNVTGTTEFAVGDEVQVFGIYDPNKEDAMSGLKTVAKVNLNGGNIESIEWASPTNGKVTQNVTGILDKDEAYLFLDYPQIFINRKTVDRNTINVQFYEGVVNKLEHVVRLRAIDKFSRASDWVYSSIIGDSDNISPNPIYFEGIDGERSIGFKFDFTADITGAEDSSYHTETNLSHIELVVVKENTTRHNAIGEDPGARSYEVRRIDTIPVNSNAKQIRDGVVQYTHETDGLSANRYAWARLVAKGGQHSNWYPDDSGSGDGTEGIGPLRGDAGIYDNLLGNDNSDNNTTTTGTTTSTSNDGQADPPDDWTSPRDDTFRPFAPFSNDIQ